MRKSGEGSTPIAGVLVRSQVIRFLAAGGVAAGANVVARYLLTPLVGYGWSIVLAFMVGLTTAWLLFRRYVFGPSDGSRAAEYIRFGVVNLAALAQVWLVSVVLAEHVFPAVNFTFHSYTVAHVVGVLSPLATSFIAHRRWSFRRRA